MKKLAVIGSPIDHSLSPSIHKIFAEMVGMDISYEAIEVTPENFKKDVDRLFFNLGYEGLNVTLPLKELANSYSKTNSRNCSLSASTNTLWLEGKEVAGDTTDGRGLISDLKSKSLKIEGASLVIVGAGGSARSVIPSLMECSPKKLLIINRTLEKAQNIASLFTSSSVEITAGRLGNDLSDLCDGIINTTSAGVLNEHIDYPKNLFHPSSWAYDLSYSSQQTFFSDQAKKANCSQIHDGFGMLFRQAAFSFEIWTGRRPDVEKAIDIFKQKFSR